jgi:sRNA-binding protein
VAALAGHAESAKPRLEEEAEAEKEKQRASSDLSRRENVEIIAGKEEPVLPKNKTDTQTMTQSTGNAAEPFGVRTLSCVQTGNKAHGLRRWAGK